MENDLEKLQISAQELHLSLTELAKRLDVSRPHLSAVINGRRPVTHKMIERLETLLRQSDNPPGESSTQTKVDTARKSIDDIVAAQAELARRLSNIERLLIEVLAQLRAGRGG